MRMKLELTAIFFAAALQSCSPCKVIEAQFPVMVSYVQEAEQAVAQVEAVVQLAGPLLKPEQKDSITVALKEAHAGLQAASQGMRDGLASCKLQAQSELFKEFNAAWSVIKPLIPVLFAAVASKQVGMGSTTIKDPAVFAEKGRR